MIKRIIQLSLSMIILAGGFSLLGFSSREDEYKDKRIYMVRVQIESRGVSDKRVLKAMKEVPRHLFVPPNMRENAYADSPLPIEYDQTISQPYIVAYMTENLDLKPEDKVLEIGTGSGYQAAVLSKLVKEVYTIEIVRELARSAQARLEELGYDNVKVKCGDGYAGWPENAPFDAIMVTAAPDKIPKELVKQLKIGGSMIVPVGSFFQELYLVKRTETGHTKEALLPVRFVPMVHGKE